MSGRTAAICSKDIGIFKYAELPQLVQWDILSFSRPRIMKQSNGKKKILDTKFNLIGT